MKHSLSIITDSKKKNASSTSGDCPQNTWVYIWKMTPDKVGHAAMQVGGCEPKKEKHNPGEYISIHPKLIPSIGPTTLLPLPAGLNDTLTEDMLTEASAPDFIGNSDSPVSFRPEVKDSVAPDYTFKIPGLNTQAMLAAVETTREEVQTGETAYQLFPKINTLKFFKEIPHYLNYNPVDIKDCLKNKQKTKLYGDNRRNCVTLVDDILNAGGMPAMQSNAPWGQTPNGLAEQLLKNDTVSIVKK